MNGKYSTGYFTPQANKVKKNTRPRLSESHENLPVAMDISDSLFENLMSCPIKRQLVLNLIASEKDNIEKYKKEEDKKLKGHNESPLSKVKKKHLCESPTALLRRKALQQQGRQSPISENQSDDNKSRPNSRQSSTSSEPSLIPFNKLLDGVIAYVEIKSKDEKDRSKGAKALLQSMGAIVRDKFTNDVTHVIFKDGSFTTYQKARLMRAHLVSVLWIEAVRSSNTKVSEKKFPALGTEAYDHNVSSLCSQMQKDYEEIIRDELRRSLATGTPLPSTQSFIDRRRTIMTPTASTSRFCSQESQSSQDREVDQIIRHGRKINNFEKPCTGSPFLSSSPEMTDDDSDLTLFINGSSIKRKGDTVIRISDQEQVVTNSVENVNNSSASSMELTNILGTISARNSKNLGSSMDLTTLDDHLIIDESDENSTKENNAPNISDNSIYYKKTPKLKSKKSLETSLTPKRSVDNLFNIPDESMYKRRTRQLKSNVDISSDNSTNISNEMILKEKTDSPSQSAMSILQLSHQDNVQILSKNACATNTDPLKMQQVSTEKPSSNVEKSTSTNATNMSSLHISPDSNKDRENNVDKAAEKSSSTTSTNMSSLLIPSDSIKDKTNRSTQQNHTESNNNFVNTNDKNKLETPLKEAKPNQSYNSSISDGNMSYEIKQVLRVLDETPLPDANVNKRRGTCSANKNVVNIPRRKTILPDENITDSANSRKSKKDLQEETSPLKKLRTDLKSEEVAAKTPKKRDSDSENSDSNKRKLHGRRKTTNIELDLVSKKTNENISKSKTPSNAKTPKKNDTDLEDSSANTRKLRERRQTTIKGNEPDIKSKKTNGDKSGCEASSSDSHSASDSTGSGKKGKKLRRLYNPDESIKDVIESDEQEREDKRTKVRGLKSNKGVILNPNIVCVTSNILLTAKAKAFVDKNNIDVQLVLNKGSEDSEQEETSTKATKKTKEKQILRADSDADEQQELAEEFINKKKNKSSILAKKVDVRSEGKIVKRRQSVRLPQFPKKNLNLDTSTSSPDEGISKRRKSVRLSQHPRKKLDLNGSTSSNDEKITIPITPVVNRRSTMEFQTLSQMSAKKKLKIDKNKRPSIVCTKMHKDDIQVFNQIVRKLGGFVIEDEVSSKTTHLVAGEPKRTINMLRAIAMGCWVLKHEWLLSSLEEGRWLPEEDYEETDFSPAVQQCRLQRQAFGPSYSMDIFQHCEPIYISRESIPRCSDLRELVSLCKGKVVTALRNAGIVVGELVRREGVKCVKETWVLDSITFNRKMPLKKYIIPPGNNSLIV